MDPFKAIPLEAKRDDWIGEGEVPKTALWTMSPEELMKKFWDTVRKQMEAQPAHDPLHRPPAIRPPSQAVRG